MSSSYISSSNKCLRPFIRQIKSQIGSSSRLYGTHYQQQQQQHRLLFAKPESISPSIIYQCLTRNGIRLINNQSSSSSSSFSPKRLDFRSRYFSSSSINFNNDSDIKKSKIVRPVRNVRPVDLPPPQKKEETKKEDKKAKEFSVKFKLLLFLGALAGATSILRMYYGEEERCKYCINKVSFHFTFTSISQKKKEKMSVYCCL